MWISGLFSFAKWNSRDVAFSSVPTPSGQAEARKTVSVMLQGRRSIATVLVKLGLDPIYISSVAQCRELLAKEHIDLIFCDRFLSDGDYCDILSVSRFSKSEPYLVLACHHNNADYHQAIAQGIFGVITAPCRATDVEWMLIQAKQKERQRGHSELNRGTTELLPARRSSSKSVA